jgi:uncharacterized protein (DUF2062 family)
MEYKTGAFILNMDNIQDIEISLQWFNENISNIILPLYVGTAFYSFIITPVIFFLINYSWIKSIKKVKNEKTKNNTSK